MAEFPNLLPPNLQSLQIDSQAASNANRKKLGQEQFFQLMIAQLKSQDPLKPLDSNQFLSQVAQFSTVSGIQDMQSSISQLAGSLQSNQALQASTLVGRDVLVPGDVGSLVPGQTLSGAIDLPESSGALSLDILTPAGELVRQLDLGAQGAGQVKFAWDGRTAGGGTAAPGSYVVRAHALVNGETQAVGTLIASRVESVTLKSNPPGLTLNLENLGAVSFNDVRELL